MADYLSSMLTRRKMIAAGGAALLFPRTARADGPLDAVLDAASGLDQLHAVLVLKDGQELAARRYRGPAIDRAVNIKSVSKSVVAAVAGAAIDRGIIDGVSARLGDVAPALIPSNADARVADITIGDLLTLRAGLERTSGANYGGWIASGNWVGNALSRPFVASPGGRMLYSTGSTHVLGAALSEAAGRSLLALTRDWLGDPLGIDIPAWTRDPQGYYLGGNEMALTPRAMAAFGEMIRRRGETEDGRRVLSSNWVDDTFEPRTRSIFSGLGYGYGWFLGRVEGSAFALARGYGGQIIAVAPDLNLTVVITSDPTRPARSGGYFGDLMDLYAQIAKATA